jgi:tRNA threonylcarbamoyladenosine biosynthesis protein TsaB
MKRNILAIEASIQGCSVGIATGNNEIYIETERDHRGQSKNILTMIDLILNKAEISLCNLDGIALTVGPGSFTGIRLAITTAQGLAIVNNTPILGISSLHAYAFAAYQAYQISHIVVCLNAFMNQIFVGNYQFTGNINTFTSSELLLEPQAFLCDDNKDNELLGVGNGWLQYASEIPCKPNRIDDQLEIDAETILAMSKQMQTPKWQSATQIEARYLRQSSAWRKR